MKAIAAVAGKLLWERAKVKSAELGKGLRLAAQYSYEHLLFLGGLAIIAYGVWLFYRPLGFVIGGWSLVRVSILMAQERK